MTRTRNLTKTPRKTRRLDSFSLHVSQTWETAIEQRTVVLPFTDKIRAKSFQYEAYHYRTALREFDFPKFSLIQDFKVLLRETAKVEMEPRKFDEKTYPYLLIIMSTDDAFGDAVKAAGIEVE